MKNRNSSRVDESRAILDALRRLVQTVQQSSKSVESRFGVSGAQLFVLHKASEANASSINELAEKTLTHQSSVSVVVDKLVSKGFVERKQDENDRRKTLVTVTKLGRSLLKQAPLAPQEELSKGILALADSERKALSSGLTRLLEEIGYGDERPPMLFEDAAKRQDKKS